MKRFAKHVMVTTITALIAASNAFAGSCDDYPYSIGMNVEDAKGGTKIVATQSASVSFDDVDSIKDAHDDATMEAKAMISKFMTETISSDEAVSRAVNETKSMTGNEKKVLRQETINRVKQLRNSSRALLRGVVVLGDCYTKGREVRVSVGIKPETIAQAGNLAGSISNSVSANKTPARDGSASPSAQPASPASTSDGAKTTGLHGRESYSNTKRLDNF
ncbi:hypothetical protein ANRL3_02826 [Anaerolineae bacterium]|nr:hypothetical protein ANRL3_02826 [Anaerolineae bacterium]